MCRQLPVMGGQNLIIIISGGQEAIPYVNTEVST